MAVKPISATAKLASRDKPGGPSPGGWFDSSPHVGWTTGEIQNQIGTKNKDKKKLVMEIWYEFFHDTATTYQWSVRYRLKAEDKNLVGSGWHLVSQLASLTHNFKYKQGSAAAVTHSGTSALSGQSDTSGMLFGGTAATTAQLPLFQIKHATGVRFGGSSGIQIVW